jgi:hypothetical protein
MKKLIIFPLVAILIAGTVFAQDRNNRQEPDRQREINKVTIDGTLKLEKGFVAAQSGDAVYLVPMLNRYIGFINGLKEDVKVSIEGYLFRNIIHPIKVTIEGKSYDFPAAGPGFRMQNYNFGPVPMPNFRYIPDPGPWERLDLYRNNRQNRRYLPNSAEEG